MEYRQYKEYKGENMKRSVVKTKFTHRISLFFRVFLIILISAIVFYGVFAFMYLENVKTANAESIVNALSSYDYIVQYVRRAAGQIYEDNNKDKFLTVEDEADKYFYFRRLNSYIATTQFIDSINIISDGNVYNIGGYQTDESIFNFVNNNMDAYAPILRKIDDGSKNGRYVYSLIYYEATNPDGSVSDLIVLNFEENLGTQLVSVSSEEQNYFISDQNGNYLLSTMKVVDYEKIKSKIGDVTTFNGGNNQAKKVDIDGVSYYITNKQIKNQNVAVLTKESKFFKNFRTTLGLTILLSVAFCISLCLVILIYSKYFLNMLKSLKEQLDKSEDKYQKNRGRIKEMFILEILKSNDLDFENIEEKLLELDIGISTDDEIRLVLFELDKNINSEKITHFSKNNIDFLYKQIGILGIVECVMPNSSQIAIIIANPDNELLKEKIETIQSRFAHETGSTISAFVSKKIKGLDKIHDLYNEVNELAKCKFLLGNSCVVLSDDISNEGNTDNYIEDYYCYEQNISNAFKKKQGAKAMELFNDFLHSDFIMNNSFKASEMVKKILFSLFLEFSLSDGKVKDALILKIDNVSTIDEARAVFEKMNEYNDNDASPVLSGREKIIDEAEKYVDEHYTDCNLAISVVADRIGLSSGYLGQLYKKYKHYSLNDYINSKRMEAAKTMIETTNEPILDIALKVGITNKTHFYKLFKQFYNDTPTSFRRKQ